MPSRNTVHGKGVGLKSRIRGRRLVGIWSALEATQQIKFRIGNSLRWPRPTTLFLAARMRNAHTLFQIQWFTKSCPKTQLNLSKKSLRKRRQFDGLGRPKRETVAKFVTWDARNVKQSPILRPGALET